MNTGIRYWESKVPGRLEYIVSEHAAQNPCKSASDDVARLMNAADHAQDGKDNP